MMRELKDTLRSYRKLEKAYVSENKGTDEYLAAVSLFEFASFRLLSTSSKDRLIGFKMIYRIFTQGNKQREAAIHELDSDSATIILAGGKPGAQPIVDYISTSSGEKIKSYIGKDNLLLSNVISISEKLAFMPFALKQAIRCVFNWRRINLALTIHELLEIAYVLKYVRENSVQHVYDFFPYEVDSNFLTLLLREMGVKVTKNPSPGPLVTHNRILIADAVTISSPYQLEELKKFSDTIRVKEYLKWPPEKAYSYQDRYLQHIPTTAYTLGFYSHGQWIRREESHADDGVTSNGGESEILQWLGRMLKEMPHFKLLIFPHPKERSLTGGHKMEEFYRSILGDVNYEIVPKDVKTMFALEKVDIAVVLFSTVIYERLYCGYKTIIGNKMVHSFPMNGSPLNNICFQSYEGMKALLLEFSEKDEDYFFKKNNLEEYKYTSYPAFQLKA